MMEMDPTRINDNTDDRLTDADRQIEATIFKQGQDYAERNKRSKAENKGRAESREKIRGMGMDPNAYATAIRLIKDKTPGELADWRRDFELTLKVMGSRQKELFPEEQLKAEARIQRAKDKAAGKPRGQAELDAASDANPKSDPAAGGAQIDLEDAIAKATAADQAEGEAILAGKSDAWRDGFNAHGAQALRADNPNVEGSAEARDWFVGFEAATQRAFDAVQPEPAAAPAAPAKKPSQSERAAAKRAAAGMH